MTLEFKEFAGCLIAVISNANQRQCYWVDGTKAHAIEAHMTIDLLAHEIESAWSLFQGSSLGAGWTQVRANAWVKT